MSRDDKVSFIRTTPSTTDSWYTPPHIVESLGRFDLDPCTMSVAPFRHAGTNFYYDRGEDGLARDWHGRVWLNPPYSNWVPWLKKLSDHGDGIALISARTETRGFFDHVWYDANAVLFLQGRIRFIKPDGTKGPSPTLGSVLIAYGKTNSGALVASGLKGKYINLRNQS